MNLLNFYRILSMLFIPIALVLACMDIIILVMGLSGNPAILIIAFSIACLVIYAFTALRFLILVIGREKRVAKTLKDWIKVNSYGTLFIAFLFTMNALGSAMLTEPNLRVMLAEMLNQEPVLAKKIPIDLMLTMFRIVSITMLVIGVVSVIHVSITYKLLKKYDHFFVKE